MNNDMFVSYSHKKQENVLLILPKVMNSYILQKTHLILSYWLPNSSSTNKLAFQNQVSITFVCTLSIKSPSISLSLSLSLSLTHTHTDRHSFSLFNSSVNERQGNLKLQAPYSKLPNSKKQSLVLIPTKFAIEAKPVKFPILL